MIKKITLLTALLALSGCSTYYEMKNCDPAKNYINANPAAIEKYKELFKNGEIKSYYSKITPIKSCVDNECLSYNSLIYDYQEKYFNDSTRQGIYTIRLSKKLDEKNCVTKKYSSDKNCYIVTKNNNNEIRSRFFVELSFDNDIEYQKFTDLLDNVVLYEASIQRYHIPNFLGVPSSGVCKIKRTPSDYQLNIVDYPYN